MNRLPEGILHNLPEGMNKFWRIVKSGAHFKLRDTEAVCVMARLVIDLAQRFHMVGDEGDRHDTDFADSLGRKLTERPVQGRLQPATGAHFALIAEAMMIAPSAALHQQLNGLFDLALIGISLFDHRHWDAVGAENDFRALG